MELVSQMIEVQQQRPNLNQNVYTNSDNVTVYMDGVAIGTIQSIQTNRDRPSESVQIRDEEEAYFYFGEPQIQREANIVIDEGAISQRLLREMLDDQMRSMSISYDYERPPNRAERRGQKREDENFQQGVRRMLGGRRAWS